MKAARIGSKKVREQPSEAEETLEYAKARKKETFKAADRKMGQSGERNMADEEDMQEAEELTEDYCRRMHENGKDHSREEESPQGEMFKNVWGTSEICDA